MSMLFSIIRITPAVMTMRRYSTVFVVFFGAMWTALLLQKTIICARDRSWYALAKPQCHLGEAVAYTELTSTCLTYNVFGPSCSLPTFTLADFISDAILLVLPFRMFRIPKSVFLILLK
jgi:hypothetical protein